MYNSMPSARRYVISDDLAKINSLKGNKINLVILI